MIGCQRLQKIPVLILDQSPFLSRQNQVKATFHWPKCHIHLTVSQNLKIRKNHNNLIQITTVIRIYQDMR